MNYLLIYLAASSQRYLLYLLYLFWSPFASEKKKKKAEYF